MELLSENNKNMINIEKTNLLFSLNLIRTWVQLKLKEYDISSKQVVDILDDWVVTLVEKENAAVY